jgi:type VI protein secretion system component VasF
MKTLKLHRDVSYGIEFAKAIRLTSTREEMKMVRCLLCGDIHNVESTLKYLNVSPERINKAVKTGIYIELCR